MSEEKKEGPSKKEAKTALDAAKTAQREFMTENKIKEDTDPETLEKPIRKKLKALQAEVAAARAAWKELKGAASGRTSTYTYPDGMTDPKEKKRYRAKMRAEKNKAEKGEAPAKPKKAAAEAEAPAKKKKVADD